MKLLTAALAVVASILFVSCAAPIVTQDGCVLAPIIKPPTDHQVYLGACASKAIVARYKSPENIWLEASFTEETEEWTLRYQAPDGSWMAYDSKSGLFTFGPLVDAINSAEAAEAAGS